MKSPAFVFLAAWLVGACSKGESRAPEAAREITGPCQPAFGTDICTWARFSGTQLLTLGATIPMASIENTPTDAPMAWPPVASAVIPMPAEARTATGVDHLTIYWEPHGHPPGAFLTPHFDFHFYVISDRTRQAIDCSDTAKPDALPPGYALDDMDLPGIGHLVGLCVPQMGMHSLRAAAVQDTTPFSGEMVLGFYRQQPIFFEPMISRATLLERHSFSLPIPTPAGMAAGVHFPTRFEAVYDAAVPGYRFVFSGFSS